MPQLIFEMFNNHSERCGKPPKVSNDTSTNYYGYFQNEHGEQWIFVYNRESKTAELYGGDIGWQNVHKIIDGNVKDLILNSGELSWLQSCWKAATAFEESRLKK